MNIGSITVSEPLEYSMPNVNFMEYYSRAMNDKLCEETNKLIYEFAQRQHISLPWVCENFEVSITPSGIDTSNSSDNTKITTTWTYELKLIPKRGSILNPYPPED